MFPTPSAQILLMVAVGAVGAVIFEVVFGQDVLARLVAHAFGGVVALLFAYQQYAHLPLRADLLISYFLRRPALVFIGMSALLASVVESAPRQNALKRLVIHYFALLVVAGLVDLS